MLKERAVKGQMELKTELETEMGEMKEEAKIDLMLKNNR